MAPRDLGSADEPRHAQGGRDSEGTKKLIRLASKEAALDKIKAIHEKHASRESESDTDPAKQLTVANDIGAGKVPESNLLMLDPSFVLSQDGVDWLQEDHEALPGIIVPSAFMMWLREGGPAEDILIFVAPEDRDEFEERRALLSQLLRSSTAFSFENAQLDVPEQEVLLALQEPGELVSMIFADEWAFLQSHSWAISKLHLPLDAFRDAGAAVVEYGRRLRDEMVGVVIPQKSAPPALTRKLLAKASAKWLLLGAAGAGGAMVGAIGGAVIGSGAAIPVVRAFDP